LPACSSMGTAGGVREEAEEAAMAGEPRRGGGEWP
jgi:hypothetical protein